MITRAVYNNKAFKIIDDYGFKVSNNEVTFNDIKIDFTNCTIADMPYKFQEIQIRQAETEEEILTNYKILFTGYLDEIDLSEMKMQKEFREMTLTLLSPLKMATKRSVTLIGTHEVKTAIKRVLQPLIDDGFIIKEINITDGQITTNYVLDTVENCMNEIGFKRNIFWYINEQKEIFVNSIDYLFGLQVAKSINQNIKEKGLLKIQPKISNTDYANIINFKNVRLVYSEMDSNIEDPEASKNGGNIYPILTLDRTLKNGDIVNFDNPIIIDESLLRQVIQEKNNDNLYNKYYCLYLDIKTSNNKFKTYKIYISYKNGKESDFTTEGDITYSNDNGDEGEIVLQRDNFFTNLITGFKWNGDSNATLVGIESDTALRYTTMRFMYSAEINKLKGIVSKSGQVEKTIDYNEKWTTLSQLISYARSLMTQNSKTVNEVELEYDINPNLKVGDIVEINEPYFYLQGKFTVKDIEYKYYNEIEQNWKITLKSTDLISTYIDMFRPAQKQENEDNINTVVLSEYIEETIKELHELELDKEKYTLNFEI